MHISISGHHVDVTPAIRDYISQKLERLTRHSDAITRIECVMEVEKERQKAEATVHIAGADLHASSESDDLYASIDGLVHKLDRQLLKHKEKNVARSQGAA